MAFLSWSNDYSVGIYSIDQQHQRLIELLNTFYDNLKSRSNTEHISFFLSGMKKYSLEHFKYEEQMMQKFNYEGLEEHQYEHNMFISNVEILEEKFKSGKTILSYEITSFLKVWLKEHIQGVDKKYSQFLIKQGAV